MVEYLQPEGLDATYSALSHGMRRDILGRLRSGPATVTALAEPYDVSLAAVSKHLRVLESATLVRRAVDGREHRLSLEAAPLGAVSSWLETYRRFWEGRLETLEELLRERGHDGR